MTRQKSTWFKELVAYGLIAFFFYLFLFVDLKHEQWSVPSNLLTVNTIFLSIVLEAIPFVMLGVFISALIQIFVSEEMIQRILPKNALVALFPAALLGIIFPVCECAIVPVVRRLIKKGMPLHVGIVFLVAAPVLNPVVFASTYYAFQSKPEIPYSRMGLSFVAAILIGLVIWLLFKKTNQLKWSKEELMGKGPKYAASPDIGKWKSTFYHAADEFFDMGKYLLLGALIASVFQTFLDRSFLQTLGSNEIQSPAIMMGLAYILSLCSEADAFIAASFGSTFTAGSLLAFLVYGPMIDLKNTIMLLAFFRTKFTLVLIGVITSVVYILVLICQAIIL